MKIRGRQAPVRDYVVDLRARLKEIGGGLGDGLFDEHEREDDNYLIGLLLGTPLSEGGETENRANANRNST